MVRDTYSRSQRACVHAALKVLVATPRVDFAFRGDGKAVPAARGDLHDVGVLECAYYCWLGGAVPALTQAVV